jgi:hypothetical protein
MAKKIILPFVYIAEWVLFFGILILSYVYHMAHLSNFVSLIGNPNKPTVIPIEEPLFITIFLGVFFFIYLKFLTGRKIYREIKLVTWGVVFGTTTLLSSIWLILNFIKFGDNLLSNQFVLAATISINLPLTVQTILMFKRERNK